MNARDNYPFPHVLIAGFPRCGTTSLLETLSSFESVDCIGQIRPEPKILVNWNGNLHNLIFTYQKYFPSKNSIRLEKSTTYSESPATYHLWNKINPELKWVFLLRDPIDRLISNYNWSKKNGFETRDLHIAMKQSIDSLEIGAPPKPFDYIWRSLYGLHLNNWLRYNNRSKLFLASIEQINSKDNSQIQSLFEFIGYETNSLRKIEISHLNTSSGVDTSRNLCEELFEKLMTIFKQDISNLTFNFPELNLSLWKNY